MSVAFEAIHAEGGLSAAQAGLRSAPCKRLPILVAHDARLTQSSKQAKPAVKKPYFLQMAVMLERDKSLRRAGLYQSGGGERII